MSRQLRDQLLSATAILFTVLALGVVSAAPADAAMRFSCCLTRSQCSNSSTQNCVYGASCDDVDWLAICDPE